MSIHDELRNELKEAMKGKDQWRLDVIRQIESEISMARTAPGFKGEVNDDLYQQVIASYIKKMDKALNEYKALGDPAKKMVEKLSYEVGYLSRWMPEKAGEEETRALVVQAVKDLDLHDAKQVGKLVGHLMKSHKGLDGALVNRLAREAIEKKQSP